MSSSATSECAFDYFDHDADVGVIGRGATIEQAFEQAAAATFTLMGVVDEANPSKSIAFEFEESDRELALVIWLNRLLAEARARGLKLGRFSLRRLDGHWRGEAQGVPWRKGEDRGVEVKGATLTMLFVGPTRNGWEARCVVDV